MSCCDMLTLLPQYVQYAQQHNNLSQDYEFLSENVAVRASGSSTARDAAAAQDALTDYMKVTMFDQSSLW